MSQIIARNIQASYGHNAILSGVDVTLEGGLTTIIGPNGCGKSTLLKALSRLLPSTGELLLNGSDMRTMSRKHLAQELAMLPQHPIAPEGVEVADLVSRGRHPHQSWLKQWSKEDAQEVARALELTNCADLAQRSLDSLSGGQRQRVWISMVLAQNTDVIFLDEPTTYLDLAHSIDVLNLVAQLRDQGKTIVTVLHDLNLAAQYSDHLIVLHRGKVRAQGTPREVLTEALLAEVFGLKALVMDNPVAEAPLVVPVAHS